MQRGPVQVFENSNQNKLHGLYVLTHDELMPQDRYFFMVEEALRGGARLVQLRDKRKPDRAMLEKAQKLRLLCEKYNAIFIVNDHLDIAVESGAHGIHVGEDDADISDVRKIIDSGIVGVSCYNDLERAQRAAFLGADYVAFGSFFPSPVKPDARKADIELLKQAKEVLHVPVCAIGGITANNAARLVDAGADMTAVITDIWRAPDIREQAARYSKLFGRTRHL